MILAPLAAGLAPVMIGAPVGPQLAVLGGGVAMPLVPVAVVAPQPIVYTPAATVTAVPAPYVAPVYPRKQDRN